MTKKLLAILILVSTFMFGFTFKGMISSHINDNVDKKVTGIGGVFFKAQDPVKLKEWYKQHLGFNTDQYGTVFEWREGFDSTRKGYTQWSAFSAKTTYFNPSTKDFMINYRVVNLVQLVDELKRDGVTVVDSIATVDYGKFVHIMDLEGNKLELWEPK